MSDLVVGVFICLVGSTLTAFGVVLQKYAHQVHDSRLDVGDRVLDVMKSPGTPYYLQPCWVLGFFIFVAAQGINVIALALAPLMVISCLGSWSLVCNAVFAQLLLGEALDRHQWTAVLGLVAAVLLVVVSAPCPGPGQPRMNMGNAPALAADFLRPGFQALTAVLVGIVFILRAVALGFRTTPRTPQAFLHVVSPVMHDQSDGDPATVDIAKPDPSPYCSADTPQLQPSWRAQSATTAAAVEAAIVYACCFPSSSSGRCWSCQAKLVPSATCCVERLIRRLRGVPLGPISWAVASAVAGGYAALLFKCIAQIAVATAAQQDAKAESPWSCWQTYAIACAALMLGPTQVHLLNLALRHGAAVTVVPTYFALGMISQLLTGAVFFRELKDFQSTLHALAFGSGVTLALTFVVIMAKSSPHLSAEACDGEKPIPRPAAEVGLREPLLDTRRDTE